MAHWNKFYLNRKYIYDLSFSIDSIILVMEIYFNTLNELHQIHIQGQLNDILVSVICLIPSIDEQEALLVSENQDKWFYLNLYRIIVDEFFIFLFKILISLNDINSIDNQLL